MFGLCVGFNGRASDSGGEKSFSCGEECCDESTRLTKFVVMIVVQMVVVVVMIIVIVQ